MYSRSRGILYADLPSADEDEETRTRTRASTDEEESLLEEPSADDVPSAASHASPVPEPADD